MGQHSPKRQEEIIITLLRCFHRPDRGMAHVPLHLIGVAFNLGEESHRLLIWVALSPLLGYYE